MKFQTKLRFSFAIALSIAILMMTWTTRALGIEEGLALSQTGISDQAGKYLGAGIAVAVAGYGSSIGMGTASAAAIGAVSENEDLLSSALIFVVLIEAVAIYGLLIALLLIFS